MKIYRISPLKEIFWNRQNLIKPYFKSEEDFKAFFSEYFIQITELKIKITKFLTNEIEVLLFSKEKDNPENEKNFPNIIAIDLNDDQNYRFYNFSQQVSYLDNKNIKSVYKLDIWLTYIMKLQISGNANIVQSHLDVRDPKNQEIIKYQDFGELNYIVKDTRQLKIKTGNNDHDAFINRGWYLFFFSGKYNEDTSYAATDGTKFYNGENYWKYPLRIVAIPSTSNVFVDRDVEDKYELDTFYDSLLASGSETLQNIVLVNYLPVNNIGETDAFLKDKNGNCFLSEGETNVKTFYNFEYRKFESGNGDSDEKELINNPYLIMENWHNENEYMFPVKPIVSITHGVAKSGLDIDTMDSGWEPSKLIFSYVHKKFDNQQEADKLALDNLKSEYIHMTGGEYLDNSQIYDSKNEGENYYNSGFEAKIDGIVYPIIREQDTKKKYYSGFVYTGKAEHYEVDLKKFFESEQKNVAELVVHVQYHYYDRSESEVTQYYQYRFSKKYLNKEISDNYTYSNYSLTHDGDESNLYGNAYLNISKKVYDSKLNFYTQTHVEAKSKKAICVANDYNNTEDWKEKDYQKKGYRLKITIYQYSFNDLQINTNYPYQFHDYKKDKNYLKKSLTKIHISKNNLEPIELDLSKLENDFFEKMKVKVLVNNLLPGEEFYIDDKNYSTETYRNNVILFSQLNDLPFTKEDEDQKQANKSGLIRSTIISPALKATLGVTKISSEVAEDRYLKAALDSTKLAIGTGKWAYRTYKGFSNRNNKLILDNAVNNNSDYLYNAFFSMKVSGYNLVLEQPIDSQYNALHNELKNFGYQINKLLNIDNNFLKTQEFFNYIKISNSSEVISFNMAEEFLDYFGEVFSEGVKLVHYKANKKRFFVNTDLNIS